MSKLKPINEKIFSFNSGKKKLEVHCTSDAKFKNLKFVISIISQQGGIFSISFSDDAFLRVLWQFAIMPIFTLKKKLKLLRIQSEIKNKITKKQIKEIIGAEHPLSKIKFEKIGFNKHTNLWFVKTKIHTGEEEISKEFNLDDQGKIISFDYPNI